MQILRYQIEPRTTRQRGSYGRSLSIDLNTGTNINMNVDTIVDITSQTRHDSLTTTVIPFRQLLYPERGPSQARLHGMIRTVVMLWSYPTKAKVPPMDECRSNLACQSHVNGSFLSSSKGGALQSSIKTPAACRYRSEPLLLSQP